MLRNVENFRTDFHPKEITNLTLSGLVNGGATAAKSLKFSVWLLVSIGNL